jgi:hypothetical protein
MRWKPQVALVDCLAEPGGWWRRQQTLMPFAVDEKVSNIMSAAEDAVMALKNECKRLLVLLPAKVCRHLRRHLV